MYRISFFAFTQINALKLVPSISRKSAITRLQFSNRFKDYSKPLRTRPKFSKRLENSSKHRHLPKYNFVLLATVWFMLCFAGDFWPCTVGDRPSSATRISGNHTVVDMLASPTTQTRLMAAGFCIDTRSPDPVMRHGADRGRINDRLDVWWRARVSGQRGGCWVGIKGRGKE